MKSFKSCGQFDKSFDNPKIISQISISIFNGKQNCCNSGRQSFHNFFLSSSNSTKLKRNDREKKKTLNYNKKKNNYLYI